MIENFPCGLFVSNINERQIEFANSHICTTLSYKKADFIGLDVNIMFSKASLIFLESYVYPTLLKENELSEIQLTMIDKNGKKIPIVANINHQDEAVFWSTFTAVNRDKHYQELLDVRDQLEQQTEVLNLAAATDPLTHLFNRRSAIEKTEQAIQESCKNSLPLTIAMLDIDYFKKINDKLGHVKGDEILVKVAKALNKQCQKYDFAVRWGGEEFLMVFYSASHQDAEEICQSIHANINSILVFDQPLTVSIGAVIYDLTPDKKITIDQIIEKADGLMYQAKQNGRNQTNLHKVSF